MNDKPGQSNEPNPSGSYAILGLRYSSSDVQLQKNYKSIKKAIKEHEQDNDLIDYNGLDKMSKEDIIEALKRIEIAYTSLNTEKNKQSYQLRLKVRSLVSQPLTLVDIAKIQFGRIHPYFAIVIKAKNGREILHFDFMYKIIKRINEAGEEKVIDFHSIYGITQGWNESEVIFSKSGKKGRKFYNWTAMYKIQTELLIELVNLAVDECTKIEKKKAVKNPNTIIHSHRPFTVAEKLNIFQNDIYFPQDLVHAAVANHGKPVYLMIGTHYLAEYTGQDIQNLKNLIPIANNLSAFELKENNTIVITSSSYTFSYVFATKESCEGFASVLLDVMKGDIKWKPEENFFSFLKKNKLIKNLIKYKMKILKDRMKELKDEYVKLEVEKTNLRTTLVDN